MQALKQFIVGRKKLPVFEKVTIEDIGAEGKSLLRIDERVVFVKDAVPGDIVDLQVYRKKSNFLEARVVNYHELSQIRTDPFCEHFGICGGCKWQQLPYNVQIKYKEKQVLDALKRIGGVEADRYESIMGSEEIRYYRNKLEYTFSNHRWLLEDEAASGTPLEHTNAVGFHVPGRFDKIVDVNQCHLQPEPSNEIRNFIRQFALEKNLSFFDHRTNEGLLRNLIIRTSISGEVMVILSVQYDESVVYELLGEINKSFPDLTSLMYCINPKKNETLYDQEIIAYSGRDHIFETLEDLKFKIGPKSFFQTNTRQALNLYRKTREFASLSGSETVYDLYTGTGTIANFIARNAGKVVGIESVPEAIDDAKINAKLNGIENISFFAGDMKDLLTSGFFDTNGRPDVIITDPPRAGMHQKVVDQIREAAPGRIVYVSCNPATQARDISWLSDMYRVEAIQPVDMFPHTHHVENIALLVLKS